MLERFLSSTAELRRFNRVEIYAVKLVDFDQFTARREL